MTPNVFVDEHLGRFAAITSGAPPYRASAPPSGGAPVRTGPGGRSWYASCG